MAKSTAKTASETLGRSPAYPFIPLDRALRRINQIYEGVGTAPISPRQARSLWGYGANSSGGIQTEAALKQFGLVTILGRGESRKLQLSDLAVRLIRRSDLSSSERYRLLEQAAFHPEIHRELRERWPHGLEQKDAQRFLIKERSFHEKGAYELVSEYVKTLRFVDSAGIEGPPPQKLAASDSDNEIILTVQGKRLSVSALIDRNGVRKLIKILQEKLPDLED